MQLVSGFAAVDVEKSCRARSYPLMSGRSRSTNRTVGTNSTARARAVAPVYATRASPYPDDCSNDASALAASTSSSTINMRGISPGGPLSRFRTPTSVRQPAAWSPREGAKPRGAARFSGATARHLVSQAGNQTSHAKFRVARNLKRTAHSNTNHRGCGS